MSTNRPWEEAEPMSIWEITGKVSDHHDFTECFAIALPPFVAGDAVVFAMLPPLDYVVTPPMIREAREFELVPRSAERGSDAPR